MHGKTRILMTSLFVVMTLITIFTGCTSKQELMRKEQEQQKAVQDSIAQADSVAKADSLAQAARADSIAAAHEKERLRLKREKEERERQAKLEAERKAKQSLQIVYFDFDESGLTTQARDILQQNAAIIQSYPAWNVVVEGHCDERGSAVYNLALGERRAASIREYYEGYGIDTARIRLVSFGEERPAVAGTGEAAWSKNRRGVTAVE